jgi:hypothetical protein
MSVCSHANVCLPSFLTIYRAQVWSSAFSSVAVRPLRPTWGFTGSLAGDGGKRGIGETPSTNVSRLRGGAKSGHFMDSEQVAGGPELWKSVFLCGTELEQMNQVYATATPRVGTHLKGRGGREERGGKSLVCHIRLINCF